MTAAILQIIASVLSIWITWTLVSTATPEMIHWLITAWVLAGAGFIAGRFMGK